MSRNYSLQCHC